MSEVVKFSGIYGTDRVEDITEIKLIGQMALYLSNKGYKLDVTDLTYSKKVTQSINFDHLFAVNLGQSNIICKKLKNPTSLKLSTVFLGVNGSYVYRDNFWLLDISKILQVGLDTDKELATLRMIAGLLFEQYIEKGSSLFKSSKIQIEVDLQYRPEMFGTLLCSLWDDTYLSSKVHLILMPKPSDREDIQEKYRRYVFLKTMELQHYKYISGLMGVAKKKGYDSRKAFRLVERCLLEKKKEILMSMKDGTVLSQVTICDVLNPKIDDETIIIFKEYLKNSDSILVRIVPKPLNTRAGFEKLYDSSPEEYAKFLKEEYMLKRITLRNDTLPLKGLGILHLCIDKHTIDLFNETGNKTNRKRSKIAKDSVFLRDTNRVYPLDSNKEVELTLYSRSDRYCGEGAYRTYKVRYPVYVYHALKAQKLHFCEEDYIERYGLNEEEINLGL